MPSLCKALSRKELASVAAKTLGSLGTDARSAVPFIVEHRKAIDGNSWRNDPTEDALSHIGPPDPSDITTLCEILPDNDCDSIMLIARAIGMIGEDGKAAANSLEDSIDRLILRARQARIEEQDPDWEDSYDRDNSAQYSAAADHCAAAFWHITNDAEKSIELIMKIASENKDPAIFVDPPPWEIFHPPSPWTTFPDKDIHLIRKLLQSGDSDIVLSGLYAVNKLGPRASGLIDAILKVRDQDFENSSLTRDSVLAAMKPKDADGLHNEVSAETVKILNSKMPARRKVERLSKLTTQSNNVIEFYIACISDSDAWSRHDAIVQLGLHSSQSDAATKPLLALLEKETHDDTRFQGEATLFLITGDKERLDQFLQTNMKPASEQASFRHRVLTTIGHLRTKGSPFVYLLTENETWFKERYTLEYCKTLGKIGDAQCQEILTRLSQSKDWKTKMLAERALRSIASEISKGETNE